MAERPEPSFSEIFAGAKMGKPPQDWVVEKVAVSGVARADTVEAQFAIDLTVLTDKYVTVPLIPSTCAVTAHTIPEGTTLAVRGGQFTFIASRKGAYRVALTVEAAYASPLRRSVTLGIPLATAASLRFEVPTAGAVVSVTPSLRTQRSAGDAGASTVAEAVLPPTGEITVKWTHGDGARDEQQGQEGAAKQKEMVVTTGQDYLHSIGGGLCTTELHHHVTVTNGCVSVLELEVDGLHGSTRPEAACEPTNGPAGVRDPAGEVAQCTGAKRVRVLAVEGAGLSRWEVSDHPQRPRAQVLRLTLETAQEGVLHFVIAAELELAGTSCLLRLPTVTPLGVNRNKGTVAIQGRTAVEIGEGGLCSRLTKADVSEIPATLSRAGGIVAAYKFLSSGHALSMRVTKHEDVDVLVATAEEALYEVTHTGDHWLYRIRYGIRNTQSQFCRVQLPDGYTIWSCSVQGAAVKPAADAAGKTLLPLVKSAQSSFVAELIFVTPAPALSDDVKDGADISVPLPTVELPVNHLWVELHMPDTHYYSQWRGPLREHEHRWPVHPTHVFARKKQALGDMWSRGARTQCDDGTPQGMRGHALLRRTSLAMEEDDRMSLASPSSGNEWMYTLNCNADSVPHAGLESQCRGDRSGEDMDKKLLPPAAGWQAPAPTREVAAGIRPLTLDTSSMKVGRAFYLDKLLLPSGAEVSASCSHCKAPQGKQRTLADQQIAGKGCCVVM